MIPRPLRLRCPDCHGVAIESAGGGHHCGGCGRTFPLQSGVLLALPASFSGEATANLEYYNAMSADPEGLLLVRERTRNYEKKGEAAMTALGLDTSSPRQTVLEIGCGSSGHGAAIHAAGHEYVGQDISPHLLIQARQRHRELADALLVAGDATNIPFDDGCFDGVFCVASLHHLPAPERGICEMLRVLRPGGAFSFMEPKRFYPTQVIQALTHPRTEVSWLRTSVRNVTRWVKERGVAECHVEHRIYTPNGPRPLVPLFDRVDRFCARWRFAMLSVTFQVWGRK